MNCLIVEDDVALRYTLNHHLTDLGHLVLEADCIANCKPILLSHKFDLLIFDYQLPDGTTEDVSTLAAVTQPNCRIILLTGSCAFPDGDHATRAPGIDWVLRKPASLPDITALIEYAARDAVVNPTPDRITI